MRICFILLLAALPLWATGQACVLQHLPYDAGTRIMPPPGHAGKAQTAQFSFQFFNTPPAAQQAISYAADIWARELSSAVPIRVYVVWFNLPAGNLGVCIPNGVRDFPAAPQPATWYSSALADALSGADLQAGEDDMTIYLNASANWYLGTDGMPPAGRTDLVSVALHEMGHGLGFVSLGKAEGVNGSFGQIQSTDFPPSSFPFPMLGGLPGAFDRELIHGASGLRLSNTAIFPNPSQALLGLFTGGDLFYTGAQARLAAGGMPPRIYAPAAFALGSSLSHLDEGAYPAGTPQSLMTPFIASQEVNHSPGAIALGMMADMGWSLASTAADEMAAVLQMQVLPNPSRGEAFLRIMLPRAAQPELHILDLQGRELTRISPAMLSAGWQQLALPAGLAPGLYVLQVRAGEFSGRLRWLKL